MGDDWETITGDSFRALRSTLQMHDSQRGKKRRQAARQLAEAVREIVEDNAEDELPHVAPALTTVKVGLTVLSECPVKIDDITYRTAMNAFQAHKAPHSARAAYANLNWFEAVQRGRFEKIDAKAWDDNREHLMTSILVAQAMQNKSVRCLVLKYGDDKALVENSMSDTYWPTALPCIWKAVKAALESSDDDDDGAVAGPSSSGRNRSPDDDDDEEDDDASEQDEPACQPLEKRSRRELV